MGEYYVDGQLFHHGIKGQKWGVRRYQNKDGSLTPAGRKRYADDTTGSYRDTAKSNRQKYKSAKRAAIDRYSDRIFDAETRQEARADEATRKYENERKSRLDIKAKKAHEAEQKKIWDDYLKEIGEIDNEYDSTMKTVKNQKRQDAYATKMQKRAERAERNAKVHRNELAELEKRGLDSRRVSERAKLNNDRRIDEIYDDFGDYLSDSEARRNNAKAINYVIQNKKLKQQAYKELVDEHNSSIKYYTDNANKWMAANEAVLNMPLESKNKDYRKAIREAKKNA